MNRSPSSPAVNPAAWAVDLPRRTPDLSSRKPPALSTGTRLTTPYGVALLAAEKTARLSGAAAWATAARQTPTALKSTRAPARRRGLEQAGLCSQVCLLDGADPNGGLGGAAERDVTLLQHVDRSATSSARCTNCSMSRIESPARLSSRRPGEDLVDHQWGQSQAEFVDEQQLWVAHQRSGDREHLLLAAGQRSRGLLLPLGQAREQLDRRSASRSSTILARRRASPTPRGAGCPARSSRGRPAVPRGRGPARRARRRPGRGRRCGAPSTLTVPAAGRTRPVRPRSVEVLPAPLGPSRATISPRSTCSGQRCGRRRPSRRRRRCRGRQADGPASRRAGRRRRTGAVMVMPAPTVRWSRGAAQVGGADLGVGADLGGRPLRRATCRSSGRRPGRRSTRPWPRRAR